MKIEAANDGHDGFVIVYEHGDQNGTLHAPPPCPIERGVYETEESTKIDSKGYPIKFRKSRRP